MLILWTRRVVRLYIYYLASLKESIRRHLVGYCLWAYIQTQPEGNVYCTAPHCTQCVCPTIQLRWKSTYSLVSCHSIQSGADMASVLHMHLQETTPSGTHITCHLGSPHCDKATQYTRVTVSILYRSVLYHLCMGPIQYNRPNGTAAAAAASWPQQSLA